MKPLFVTTMLMAVLALCVVPIIPLGCIQPPEGTILIDTNQDGTTDALAYDVNKDGIADVDEQGKPLVVPGSGIYKVTETVDATLPNLLIAAGGACGIPILLGLGAAWKQMRFGRILSNTVMSVQLARQRLKDSGNADALAIVNDALTNQAPATIAAIAKAKEQLGLQPLTEPDET